MGKKILVFSVLTGLVLNAIILTLPKPAQASVSAWQKGASIQSRWNTDFDSDSFRQSVNNLAAANANYVSLIIPYYQANLYTVDIGPGWNTPTDQALASAINYIHSKGMKVMITPHVDSYTGEWRANINPSDRSSWFANYGNILGHLAQIGQQTGAEQFCIGTELITMATFTANPDNTQQWVNLINRVRNTFSGKLTYAANWGPPPGNVNEKANIGFWQQLDYVGIDAYYNLNQAPDNSVSSLKNAWNNWLNSDILPFATSVNKPVLFTELGYKSVTGSHNQPWDYTYGGPVDQNEQANAYTALFDFWDRQNFVQGVFLWDWSSDPNAGGAGDGGYTPQNKQAQNVMTQWFGGSGSSSGGNPSPNPNPPPTVSCPGPVSNAFTQAPSDGAYGFTACYFSDQVLGNSAFTKTDQNINFDWGSGSPNSAIPNDHFSARWAGNFNLSAGDYAFSITADDGARLYIDNQLILDKWFDQPATTYTVTKTLTAGVHEIKMEYYENGGGAVAKLSWTQNGNNPPPNNSGFCPAPADGGFTGCYYSGRNFDSFILSRPDASINFDWGTGSPDPAIPVDHFSVRWQGSFNFNAGTYSFTATADDGIRVYVDNNLVIGQWKDQPPATYSANVNLSAGNHLIKIEYYENGGGTAAKLIWTQSNSGGNTTPPPPSSTIVYVNGYPTVNGNYIDCNGNVDNDPGHHTVNPSDTDPAHHVGQSCPAGSYVATH